MLRRDFIHAASLLVGSTAVSPINNLINPVLDKPMAYKKGISYYMIKEELSVIDKFKLVKDLGFDGIEINTPLDISINEVLNARDKTGIEISSVVNKDHWSKPLSDPNDEVRQYIIQSISKSLDQVKQLGGDTVLVVPGVVNEKVTYEQAWNTALKSIRSLIPHVERTNMKIGLENVWNNFILSPLEAKRFIEEINHPLIGWYFDVGNVLRYGWPEHWIETLNKHIFKVHIKEFSRDIMNKEGLSKGFSSPLTEGDINWKAVMSALQGVNYKGEWLILELGSQDRNGILDYSKRLDKIIALGKM